MYIVCVHARQRERDGRMMGGGVIGGEGDGSGMGDDQTLSVLAVVSSFFHTSSLHQQTSASQKLSS